MSAPVRVAVIGGGPGCEHDVSMASAASAVSALSGGAYDVLALTLELDGSWCAGDVRLDLARAVGLVRSCDVVLPLVHGIGGEDGTLAALCDLAGTPYVGSGLRAGAVAMDKWLTKLVAAASGIGTAPGVLLSAASSYRWDGPVVVKPVAAGSSFGVSLVDRPEGLAWALQQAFALDDRVLVERVVHGREVDVAVLARPDGSRVVSPALEIVTDGIFDSATKYDGSAQFRVPADLDEAVHCRLERAAVEMYDALGCRGVARVDFFVTGEGSIVLNEVNTVPGFTERSQVPRMFAAAGMSYAELLDTLLRDAMTTGPAGSVLEMVVPLPGQPPTYPPGGPVTTALSRLPEASAG